MFAGKEKYPAFPSDTACPMPLAPRDAHCRCSAHCNASTSRAASSGRGHQVGVRLASVRGVIGALENSLVGSVPPASPAGDHAALTPPLQRPPMLLRST